MRSSFTLDMALKNLRRNRRSMLPYALSCVGTVMVFFIMVVLANTTTLHGVYGGRTIQRTLQLGMWVMLLFAVVFLFYTHSFLIRQRKKELGLFNILGLEKRHIARILLVENFLVGIVTTAVGMGLGALLSRLLYLAQLRMLGAVQSPNLSIHSSTWPIVAIAFLCIHALTVLNTLRQVHLARPVQLLRAGNVGERAPKANWLIAVLGLVLLGWGYGISITAGDALSSIPDFFKAVLLVIVATYILFTAGTVAALILMQKNKDFYYRPGRFTVVAGMRHRMKRHAVGLASICILSTMVLVMMAATVSLYIGREDALKDRFPRDVLLSFNPVTTKQQADTIEDLVITNAKQRGVTPSRILRYRSASYYLAYDKGRAAFSPPGGDDWASQMNVTAVDIIPAEDFALATGLDAPQQAGQAYVFSNSDDKVMPTKFTVAGVELENVKSLDEISGLGANLLPVPGDNYVLVLHQQDAERIAAAIRSTIGDDQHDIIGNRALSIPQLNILFDTGPLAPEQANELLRRVNAAGVGYIIAYNDGGARSSQRHIDLDRAEHNAVYGGLLFVAVFLGAVFLMALVMIIYYKQVSEGYEDQSRFAIMQQVGMSTQEVRRSIRIQVLMVFFLPLVMAGLHLLASFNITNQVLKMLNLNDVKQFGWIALVTYLLFAVFYFLVYWKTAGSYYRIVKAGTAPERAAL